MIKKAIVLVIFSSFMIFCLTACASVINELKDSIENEKHAKELSEEVVEYINNDDVEGMKELFCEYYQNNFELEEEIEEFFDSIDGKIISYEFEYSGEIGSIRDGKWTKQSSLIDLDNIKTDSDNEYHIFISEYLVYKEDKMKEGVFDFELRNSERKKLHQFIINNQSE